jgi:hypothetical protein
MLITGGSRQCVLKLKSYSDKKDAPTRPLRSQISSSGSETSHKDENPATNPNATTSLVITKTNSPNDKINQINDSSTEIIENRSFLGRLLNCKPCQQVTDTQNRNNVCNLKTIHFYLIIKLTIF